MCLKYAGRTYDSGDEAEDDFSEEFETAIERLVGCGNVQTATLRFDKNCGSGRQHWLQDHPQTIFYRSQALETFFSWLEALEVAPRALGIHNLQDLNSAQPMLLEKIAKVL
ncbi:uncharacterized protein ACLA_062470 [Aspergillus clavatus NRRL 1]|uniref:Uncharacterized protein n=1 Tax=Aspergillus clavatus (strain ATCC 1007 / CBS 513.65 / DSM 816 / NCTC 3887 / NRRL 1 / QM 1276 / 107) TaxID=344612 RepID=A1CCM6_ASPCL|nr:uncharacterized protein ACLA_062470 [Aspergillus clavatus NRRL 1]EAW12283.1 hypothetical protein ACLA_062470 [Aspergillus clavatus NRRL 1]